MKAAFSVLCKTACVLLLIHRPASADAVYTDTSEVHACVVRGEETMAATEGGVVIVKNGSSRTLTALDGLPDGLAWAIAQSGSSTFVGTDRGLAEIVDDSVKRTALDVPVRALAISNGQLLVGTFGKGLAEVDLRTLSAAFVTLPDSRVLSISGDRIGTMGGTFVRKGETYVRTDLVPTLPRSLSCDIPASVMPSNDVSALAVSDRGLFLGTFDRGLAFLSNSNGQIRRIDGIDNRINAIAADRASGRVWVGTARGLYAIDDAIAKPPELLEAVGTDEVHALAALEGGGVVVGTAHGAAIVDPATGAEKGGASGKGSVTQIGIKGGVALPSVTAVLEDKGVLYLGTVHGLYVGRGKTFVRLSVASGHLPDDWVTALVADQDVVYAGTYNGGVVRLVKQHKDHGTIRQANRNQTEIANKDHGAWMAEKLGGGYVNPAGLAVRDGRLFVATMDGLLSRAAGETFVKIRALGRDVTAIAFGKDGTFIASRRGLLRKDAL